MKGKMGRIAAGLLAVLLIAGYWLLPGREERSIPSGGGHQKYSLEPGDSVSWPWKPAMEDCSELSVYLKGMKKGQGIILTGILTDSTGQEAAASFKEKLEKKPEQVIELAVKGMLPKGPLGRAMIKKLFVYAGSEHPHAAQKPEELKF